jgi:hypothetical protein
MRLIHPLSAAALLACPAIALAQAADTARPGATPAASSTTTAPPGAASTVTAGLPVKDKDGKPIGKVTEVKTDAGGKTIAMIKMGADSFGVNASALAVDNGAAKLNVTKSELDSYLSKGQ